jgi:hypothetical protein
VFTTIRSTIQQDFTCVFSSNLVKGIYFSGPTTNDIVTIWKVTDQSHRQIAQNNRSNKHARIKHPIVIIDSIVTKCSYYILEEENVY